MLRQKKLQVLVKNLAVVSKLQQEFFDEEEMCNRRFLSSDTKSAAHVIKQACFCMNKHGNFMSPSVTTSSADAKGKD